MASEDDCAWKRVPLSPREEPLVAIRSGPSLLVEPVYRARGHAEATAEVYVRREVRDRLVRVAAGLVSAGLELLIWDGWRSPALQRRLYDDAHARLARSSGLGGRELAELVSRYVAEPSEDPRCPSPHLTGGAVDLTLAVDGVALDMGSEFDAYEPRSHTDHFERAELSPRERLFRDRRRTLCQAMSEAGFANYPAEWWHFDLGNQFWGLRRARAAYYGAARPEESPRSSEGAAPPARSAPA